MSIGTYAARRLSVVLYLLPFMDGADLHDASYFRSAVKRELAWLRPFADESPGVVPAIEAMEGLVSGEPGRVDSTWLADRWTAFHAHKLAALRALPRIAWASALEEVRFQERKVLSSSLPVWKELLARARAAVEAGDPAAPLLIQRLHNEVEFARQHSTLRIMKYIRLANVAWLLIATILGAITAFLSRWREGNELRPVVWLVLLFGLLGGTVSALQQNERIVSRNQAGLRVGEAQLRLRPLLGAMAALVVYAVAQSGLLFRVGPPDPELAALVQLNVDSHNVPLAYYVLAFAAGFSERVYLQLLDQVSERFLDPTAARTAQTTPSP